MTAPQDMTPLQRLASLVKKRRAELHLDKVDVWRAAGISPHTYNNIENGKPVRDTTYAKIEPVLGWASGSCLEILAGATSATLVEQSPTEGVIYSDVPAEDLEEDIAQSVQNAAIAVGDQLTAAEIKKLAQRAVEEFRRRRPAR